MLQVGKKPATMERISSDDTDVLALACHFFPKESCDLAFLMEQTKASRAVTDIGSTVKKHELIIDFLLAVCQCHVIRKKTVIKVLQLHPLVNLLYPDATMT